MANPLNGWDVPCPLDCGVGEDEAYDYYLATLPPIDIEEPFIPTPIPQPPF